MAESIQLRFRHQTGDIGPLSFPESTLFQQVKERLLAEWPKDGDMSSEAPSQVADIKLIMSGKFIEASKSVKDYKKDMGELKADSVVTLHVVVRPSTTPKKTAASGATKNDEEVAKGCGCAIC